MPPVDDASAQRGAAISAALAAFTSETRLYRLDIAGQPELLVERWVAEEGLSASFVRELIVLATDASLDLDALLGCRATLSITLADGTRTSRSGLVQEAAQSGAEGGFARYRLRIVSWWWMASQQRHQRVYQDKTTLEIVEDVFARYASHASWRQTDEVAEFMADAARRSYCVQWQETDAAFALRLMAEEGLGYAFEESDDAPAGHRLVVFADSCSFPDDASAKANRGLRFHRASSQEAFDTIQTLIAERSLQAAVTTLVSYDYRNKKAVAAELPTAQA